MVDLDKLDERDVRVILAAHFHLLATRNGNRWPDDTPRLACADATVGECSIVDHATDVVAALKGADRNWVCP